MATYGAVLLTYEGMSLDKLVRARAIAPGGLEDTSVEWGNYFEESKYRGEAVKLGMAGAGTQALPSLQIGNEFVETVEMKIAIDGEWKDLATS